MHVHTTLRLGVVHSVYVAKPDVVNPTRCRRLYDLHLYHVRTVHVAKTDGVHRTLGSAEKLDSVHTTHYARSYDTTPRCRA